MTGTTPSRGAPRGSLRLIVDPVFGPFFAAKVLATAGVWIYNIVAAILVFELTGSALMVGLISAVQFGPQLVLAPLSGAMADRGDRRRQLVIGKLLIAAASGGLAFLIWRFGVDRLPSVLPVIASAFLVGIGFVLSTPAQNALIPALVRPTELAPAIALNSVPPTVARAGGPVVGAVVATTFGPALAFAIASVVNLIFAVVMLLLDAKTHADRPEGQDTRTRVAIRHMRRDRRILPVLLGVAAIGIGSDPVITLTPSLAAGFGAGQEAVGRLASAFGIGSGVVFIFLAGLRRRLGLTRLASVGLLMLSLGMASTGVSPTQTVAIMCLVIAGAGMTVAFTSLTTQLQAWVPDEIRGRVMALWSVAYLGSRPAAAAANGAVADATAPAVAFLGVGVIVAGAAWLCLSHATAE